MAIPIAMVIAGCSSASPSQFGGQAGPAPTPIEQGGGDDPEVAAPGPQQPIGQGSATHPMSMPSGLTQAPGVAVAFAESIHRQVEGEPACALATASSVHDALVRAMEGTGGPVGSTLSSVPEAMMIVVCDLRFVDGQPGRVTMPTDVGYPEVWSILLGRLAEAEIEGVT